MHQDTLNVGIIGAGRIGMIHAQNLALRIPGARVASVADVNGDAARACAERFGASGHHTEAEAVISDPEVQAVVIGSATHTHAKLMVEAAAAGKHIFCEKPIDLDLETIDVALEAVARSGVRLQIGFNRRFDPHFLEVRQTVASGRIGAPHLLQITSYDPEPPPPEYVADSGGLFLDMAIHDFDMARYLIGSEIVSVYAVGRVRIDPAIGEAGDVDTAVTTLEFADGTIGTIQNSRRAAYGYDQRVEVFGSEGSIAADNITPHRTVLADRDGIHRPLPEAFFLERYAASYLAEMEAFVACVRNGTPSPVSGADGRAPVVAGLAAKRSLAEGRPVRLDVVDPQA
jgi:myo-inositol 2-dehydrogenase/D-chiro-inositol 1-dehydrogenase